MLKSLWRKHKYLTWQLQKAMFFVLWFLRQHCTCQRLVFLGLQGKTAPCLNKCKFVSYQALCIALTLTLFRNTFSVFKLQHSKDTLTVSVKAIHSMVFLFFMFFLMLHVAPSMFCYFDYCFHDFHFYLNHTKPSKRNVPESSMVFVKLWK